MTSISRLVTSLVLGLIFLSTGFTCGPGYVTPMFETAGAPEAPYTDFAAGRLGIVKADYDRAVLYAAYRWIAGNGMSASEQQAAIEVWRAQIDKKDFRDDTVDEAVKAWVAKRAEVMGKEETPPAIYTERDYGGYDFFPNCTRNAFETATETLADRASAHAPSDANVQLWVQAQDDVFENCAQGKQTPIDLPQGAPDWLQKDHAYQDAAAEFYSLDYEAAKRDFAAIAQDSESPWAETADYLVARTLIRQASLSKSNEKVAQLYGEAETHLERFVSRSGKFSDSANRLMGLIKFRNHPQERVTELAKNLTIYAGGNENFRQDLIDYTWLLDKFQNDILTAEEKRKAALKPADANTVVDPPDPSTSPANAAIKRAAGKKDDSDLELRLYIDGETYEFYVRINATDADAVAEAERKVGKPLTKEQQDQVKSMRQSSYSSRFTNDRDSGYPGSYYGEEKLTPSLLPEYLKQDELTDWLYNYQTQGAEAYLHALAKYKVVNSDLWLMTALSKADKSSTDLARIIEAGKNVSPTSPAYPTIAFHTARLLLETGKTAEAKKLVEEMLDLGDRIPLSARNAFMGMKVKFAQTMEEFLTASLRKPFAFDFDGEVGNVDDFIAEQKKWYNPEYNKDGREAYEKEVEDNFKTEKMWQDREIFDTETVDLFNRMLPTTVMMDVEKSPALPDYMRERFVSAIWVRAWLLGDKPTLLKVTPELERYDPDYTDALARITNAKTDAVYDRAVLYFVLKNPVLSPFIEDGIGKSDNEQGDWDSNDWWCSPSDETYDDAAGAEVPRPLPKRPPFLTAVQVQSAVAERAKLKEIGDAPKFLGARVLGWAKAAPLDKRVPEALYITIQANGWTKYGCGNDEDMKNELTAFLKKHYPSSEWTTKLIKDESENQ